MPPHHPHQASWATTTAVRRAMQGNRSLDTRPEKALRSSLHALGLRFRVHHRIEAGDLRVRPDIVFTARRVCVFCDGCFWHRCPEHGADPRANSEYWGPKLQRNVDRDRRVDRALKEAGWTVIRVWEHERATEAARRVERVVRS